MLGFAGIGALVAGGIVTSQWRSRVAAQELAGLTDAAAALLRLTETLVIERGNFVARLNSPSPADDATITGSMTCSGRPMPPWSARWRRCRRMAAG